MEVTGKEKGVTPDQEIRAAAVQAAASLCAPISPLAQGRIPHPQDVMFVAKVFAEAIENGWDAALQLHGASLAPSDSQPDSVGRPDQSAAVETDVYPDVLAAVAAEVAAVPAQAPLLNGLPAQPQASQSEPMGRVVSMADHEQHNAARRRVEKMRGDRAKKLVNEAKVAKTPEHKKNLIAQSRDSGLDDFVVEVGGSWQQLGSYLASL